MNDKVKAIFFAQYLYQNVVCSYAYNSPIPLNHIQQGTDEYLLLRSINDLTDEEKIILANIYNPKIEFTDTQKVEFAGAILRDITYDLGAGSLIYSSIFEFKDYLRSIGIALPFTFLNDQNQPETYSVEKLISLGWLTIKPNN